MKHFGRTNEQLTKAYDLEKAWGFENTNYYCRETGNCIVIWDHARGTNAIAIHPDGTTGNEFSKDEWNIISRHLLAQAEQLRNSLPSAI